MGDAGLGQIVGNGQLGGHDNIVGGGEHGVHLGGDQGGGSGHHLVVGVCSLLHTGNAVLLQIRLGLGDGLGGVGLGQGVQQPHLGDAGILRQHHVQNVLGIQRIAGAGNIVDAGELGGIGIGDGGIHHRRPAVLSRHGGHLSGGGGDGNDGIHLIGHGLIRQLLQHRLIPLPGGDGVANGDVLLLSDGIQPGGDGIGDLVQRGMIHLLDDGHGIAVLILILTAIGGLGAAGGQTQHHQHGQHQRRQGLHQILLFHTGILLKNDLRRQMIPWPCRGLRKIKKRPSSHMGQKPLLLRYHPN